MPKNSTWEDTIRASADPARVRHYLDLLQQSEAAPLLRHLPPTTTHIVAALLSGSQALSESLVAHPDWIAPLLEPEALAPPRQAQGLRRDLGALLPQKLVRQDPNEALARIRRFKHQETLRIAARDLARLADVDLIIHELSDLADVCLSAVHDVCLAQLVDRFGQPWHRDPDDRWTPTAFCVLGMGKLGGQELNYSSDVDVLFVYTEEGHAAKDRPRRDEPGKGLTNHQFFKRLAEAFVAEVARMTSDGMLYRIDLRLRPEGQAGPLARSLTAYESYYWQYGQTWERMMLIKARRVAGDTSLAGEFLEMVQPFRYPRSLSDHALRDITAMKERVENEVVRTGELDRNVKLGRGGIREIEFIAQTLQILNAGRHPFLANRQTIPTLEKLAEYHLLPEADAQSLIGAYRFLRAVEHRLQMENNLQTHSLPTERAPRERLARLLAFDSLRAFEKGLEAHRLRVRHLYTRHLQDEAEPDVAPLPPFDDHEPKWLERFAQHSFRDPEKALRLARAFVHGPGFGHVSHRTENFARELLHRLLGLCPQPSRPSAPPDASSPSPPCPPDGDPNSKWLSDPDRVLARLDTFIGAYRGRALLFETWASNPSLFELLVLLIDRSEFLAETAIRTPDLVDELEQSGYLRRSKTAEHILRDLRHGHADEDQRLWLRRYHQTELMRIGLRDILGLADFEQNLIELTALADACLQYAFEVVTTRHNIPAAQLAIIGLGKLGGTELNYGSDLDIVFVAQAPVRTLPTLQRAAIEIIDLLASPTEMGVAFEVDTRLRPDGEKGLLVNTLKAYEDYYRNRARLWEIQALSRSRAIAGSPELGARFQTLVATLANFTQPSAATAGQDPNWKQEIARMRLRIEKERTPRGKEALAIKTGVGGLVDAEFIAQTLGLEHGWIEPNTLRALERARDQGALPNDAAGQLITHYRRLRRIEGVLRRWSYEGETELPDDPAPLYRVAVRCGFPTAEPFMAAVQRYRAAIREIYHQVFPPAPTPLPPGK